MKSLLLIPFLLALPASTMSILLPLYLYPGGAGTTSVPAWSKVTANSGWSNATTRDTAATAWSDVFAAISAHKTVQWQVIVNPNSGPGVEAGYPTDPNIIAGIAELNSYPNVKTIGYVDTKYAMRDISDVNNDIKVYAGWASYAQADISIHGIFFDDANYTDTDAIYTYMNDTSAYARATMPSASIVFNPGTPAPAQLFDYCDTMVEFELPYSSYNDAANIAQIPSAYRKQSAIMINTTPSTATVQSLVHTMAQGAIEAVYFGQDCCYKVYDGTLLNTLAAAVEAG